MAFREEQQGAMKAEKVDMTSLGKALAARKGKAAAKVSVDTALQNFLVSDVSAENKLIQEIEATKKATSAIADEWGVDDSEKNGTSGIGAAGHFHLITEEDVQKKQANKIARKWGEPHPDDLLPHVVDVPVEPVEVTSKESVKPQKYVAKGRRTVGPIVAKVNIQDSMSFPGLGEAAKEDAALAIDFALTATSSAPCLSAAPQKKKKEVQAVENEPVVITEEAAAPEVMTAEEFLKDVLAIMKIENVAAYDDTKTKEKFLGRFKRPYVAVADFQVT